MKVFPLTITCFAILSVGNAARTTATRTTTELGGNERLRLLAADCNGLWRCEIECSTQCVPFECQNMIGYVQSECKSGGDIACGTVEACAEGETWAPTTLSPTRTPTSAPTNSPTRTPTSAPTNSPTRTPTSAPTNSPSASPTGAPTVSPTPAPTATIETVITSDRYLWEYYKIAYDGTTDTYVVANLGEKKVTRFSTDFTSSQTVLESYAAGSVTVTPNGTVIACTTTDGIVSSTSSVFENINCYHIVAISDEKAYFLDRSQDRDRRARIWLLSLLDGTVEKLIWQGMTYDEHVVVSLNATYGKYIKAVDMYDTVTFTVSEDGTKLYIPYYMFDETWDNRVFTAVGQISIQDGTLTTVGNFKTSNGRCVRGAIVQVGSKLYVGGSDDLLTCDIDNGTCVFEGGVVGTDVDDPYVHGMAFNPKTNTIALAFSSGVALYHIP